MSTPTPKHKGQDKIKDQYNQLQTIFHLLQKQSLTASMVAEITGIYQKNICRYKRDLEKSGILWEVEKKLCKKTGFRAWYLTTNPEKAQNNSVKQLSLFAL
jgi:hypothetical protein